MVNFFKILGLNKKKIKDGDTNNNSFRGMSSFFVTK